MLISGRLRLNISIEIGDNIMPVYILIPGVTFTEEDFVKFRGRTIMWYFLQEIVCLFRDNGIK